MKLHLETREIAAEGMQNVRRFAVATDSPHIMDLLSGLYSEIEWAVVREYGTNMLDAYLALDPEEAKRRRNPRIHLPNKLEPWIEFWDNGIGMSVDTVWNVFAIYDASLKRNDAKQVGGLGVGGKVGFCYKAADVWTVESRQGGQKHVFSATKDSEGFPSLMHVGSFPTDEPDGVTVKLPVNYGDMSKFREAVQRLLTYYPMEVEITGGPMTAHKPTYVVRDEAWGIRHGSAQQVVTGNIAYPITQAVLTEHTGLAYEFLRNVAIDFFLPVGEIDITPSRESLKYTPRTIAVLKGCVATFIAEMKQKAEEHIASAETEWEAISRLYNAWGIHQLRQFLNGIPWRGKPLKLGVAIPIEEFEAAFPDIVVEHYYIGSKKATISRDKVENVKVTLDPSYLGWAFVDDLKQTTVSRVRTLLREECTHERWDGRREGKRAGYVYTFKAPGLTVEALAPFLRGFPVAPVSTLPEPEGRDGTRTKTKVKRWTGHEWADVEVVVEEGGYYVQLHGTEPASPHLTNRVVGQMQFHARKIGLLGENENIIGIPRSCASLEKKEGWEDFVAVMKPEVEKRLQKAAAKAVTFTRWQALLDQHLGGYLARLNPDDFTGVFADAIRSAREAATFGKQTEDLRTLATNLCIPLPDVAPMSDGSLVLKEVRETYPMVAAIADILQGGAYGPKARMDAHTDAIKQYVQQIGK